MKKIVDECIINIHWDDNIAYIRFPGYVYRIHTHSGLITELYHIQKECIRKEMFGPTTTGDFNFSVRAPRVLELDRLGWLPPEEQVYFMTINIEKLFDMILPKIRDYQSETGTKPHTVIVGKMLDNAMVRGTLADFRINLFHRGIPSILYVPEEEGIIVLGEMDVIRRGNDPS